MSRERTELEVILSILETGLRELRQYLERTKKIEPGTEAPGTSAQSESSEEKSSPEAVKRYRDEEDDNGPF